MFFLDKIKNKLLSKLGNKKAQGAVKRYKLVDTLYRNYMRYIGRINEKQNTETVASFLEKVGFKRNEIEIILNKSGVNDEKSSMKDEKSNEKIYEIFNNSASYAILNNFSILN